MSRGRPTLATVAERAGVSVATVSRVLSGHPYVRESTRERVKHVLAEMRFDPDALFAPFVKRRSPMIGFLVPAGMASLGFNRSVYQTLVHVIREEAEAHGFGLYAGTFSGQADGELVGDRVIRERQLQGVVVSRLRTESELQPLLDAGLPVALLNRPISADGVHSVYVDNRAAAAGIARHLLELGHRRIGVLAGPDDVYSAAERLLGYRDAVCTAGLPPESLTVEHTDLAEEQGREATARLLRGPRPPTAVLAVNDYLALAALGQAAELGVSVPDELSVAGFDDIDPVRYVTPALTTVHLPWDLLGRWGTRVLIEALGDPRVRRTSMLLDTELVVRRSTAPLAETAGRRAPHRRLAKEVQA